MRILFPFFLLKISFVKKSITFEYLKIMKIRYIIGIQFFLTIGLNFLLPAQTPVAIDSFNLYYDQKDYAKALEFWEHFEEGCKDFELLKNAGNCYLKASNYEQAFNFYDSAEKYNSGDIFRNKFILMTNRAITFYSLKNYPKTKTALSEAELFHKIHGPFELAGYHLCLGQYYNDIQESDSAEKYVLLALNGYLQRYESNSHHLLNVYSYLSTLYYYKFEYQISILFGEKGLDLIDGFTKNYHFRFLFNYKLACNYYSLKDWENAIYYFQKALENITSFDISYKSFIESALVYCYSKIDQDFSDSLFIFSSARSGCLDTVAYSYHLICYGKYLANQKKQYMNARNQYQRAFNLLEKKNGLYHEAIKDIYQILGTSSDFLLQYDSALHFYQRSIYCKYPEIDTSNYSSNPSHPHSDRWLLDLVGRKIRSLGKNRQQTLTEDSAMIINLHILANSEYYTRCLEDLMHDKTFLSDQMHVLREDIREYMLIGLDACYDLYTATGNSYYFDKGLSFSETGKYLLVKSMMDSKADKQRLPDNIAKTDADLYNRINNLHMQSSRLKASESKKNTRQIDSLGKSLFSLILQKDSLRNVILTQFPDFHKHETFHLSLDEIQNQLSPRQVLIEYFMQDTVLHAFYISATRIKWVRHEDHGEIRSAINDVVGFCNPIEKNPIEKNEYIIQAKFLFDQLLEAALNLNASANKIVIIPDGDLTSLPFEALLTEVADKNISYRYLPYVFRRFTIGYFHALRFVIPDNRNKRSETNTLLAIAPAFVQDSTAQFKWDGITIEEAGRETEYLLDLIGGEMLSGNKATKDNFISHSMGKDILHFATHGEVDPDNPFDSRLLLAPDSAFHEPQALYASEICCMNLDARLAVLSSCNTGRGKMLNGEGMISLAWAFQYAGCASVAMSLYPLDDGSARMIMTSFYINLKSGLPKDEALRQARMDFVENAVGIKTHPKYWAGIILTGDQSALFTGNMSMGMVFIALAVVVGLVVLIVMMRSRTRRKTRLKS